MFFLSQGYSAAYWDQLQRKLFVADGAVIKEWDAGTAMTATFRSKVFRQPSHDDSAERIEVVAVGSVTTKVLTTDQTAPTGPLLERMNRALTQDEYALPEACTGREWQIDLAWTGTLSGVAIT